MRAFRRRSSSRRPERPPACHRLGNAQVFRLAAQSLVSEISAVGAAGFETGLAYRALAAAERERYDHEIARLGHGHVVADLLDHADGLMSGLSVGFLAAVAVEPQVGSAHACAYTRMMHLPIDDGRFACSSHAICLTPLKIAAFMSCSFVIRIELR